MNTTHSETKKNHMKALNEIPSVSISYMPLRITQYWLKGPFRFFSPPSWKILDKDS